jgi:Mitotic-spindle organizing gamma-tubulin ring associated
MNLSFYIQGLDRKTLGTLLALCEQGVNPEALAEVVKFLRRESSTTEFPSSIDNSYKTQ